MYRRTLTLTAEQRAELERTRDRDPRAYLRECAAAVLKVSDGQAPYAVARTGLHKPRHPDTVYRWLTRYRQHGLVGLIHRARGHRGFSPSAGGGSRGPRPRAPVPGRD